MTPIRYRCRSSKRSPRGACAKVPLLIGTNRDELNLFLGPALKKLNEPLADSVLMEQAEQTAGRSDRERLRALVEVYRVRAAARQLPHGDAHCSRPSAATRSGASRAPLRRGVPPNQQPATFQYLFTYESPAMRGALRSCHGLELAFMFGTLDAPGQAQFAGSGEAQAAPERAHDGLPGFPLRARAIQARPESGPGPPTISSAGRPWCSIERAGSSTRPTRMSAQPGTISRRARFETVPLVPGSRACGRPSRLDPGVT